MFYKIKEHFKICYSVYIFIFITVIITFVFIKFVPYKEISLSDNEKMLIEISSTVVSIIFAIQLFIIQFLKEKIYDKQEYIESLKETGLFDETELKIEIYRPLNNLNNFLTLSIACGISIPLFIFIKHTKIIKESVNNILIISSTIFFICSFLFLIYISYSNIKQVIKFKN